MTREKGRAVMGGGSGILVSIQIVTTTQTTLTSGSLAKSQNLAENLENGSHCRRQVAFPGKTGRDADGKPPLG